MRRIFLSFSVTFSFLLAAFSVSAQNGSLTEHEVKNVIYMIGDGMGVAQVTQLILENGLKPINMERAEAVGLVRTFSANNRVTDSAAAGTALATGTKTDNGKLGIDPDGNSLSSIMEWCKEEGMATGFVVTVQVTHATPAAFYAHVDDRNKYEEIAEQLLESGTDVFLGGGLDDFASRGDGKDLVAELKNLGYRVETELEDIETITSGKVAGLLRESDSLPYGRPVDYLPRATAKALEILKNNSGNEGFFLMVEGSMIDYAGHDNDAERLIFETRDFDDAVGVAFDFAAHNPGTLVIVLADHETGGLALPSGNSDFTASESGVEYRFSSDSHTASLIPLFAFGPGARHFSGVFDNTIIPLMIKRLLER